MKIENDRKQVTSAAVPLKGETAPLPFSVDAENGSGGRVQSQRTTDITNQYA